MNRSRFDTVIRIFAACRSRWHILAMTGSG
jgi:hypothetical protein